MSRGNYKKMKAPRGFDHTNPAHVAKLVSYFEEKEQTTGWELVSYSEEDGYVVFARGTSVMSTVAQADGSELVSLGSDFKPSDADKRVAILESTPGNEGKYVVELDPHLKRARIAPLSEDELRVREATATTLGTKPYNVQIKKRADGGYDLNLPGSYLAAKHDHKLQEITEGVAGEFGWYCKIDQRTRKASMIPSTPPTFEAVVPFDFDAAPTPQSVDEDALWRIPLGMGLGLPGQPNHLIEIDYSDAVGDLTVGLAGSGKSASTQSQVFSCLARGWQLALINTVDKATDFAWAKPYVRDHMWGCDSVEQAVTVAKLVIEEGARRGDLLNHYGVSKLQQLPKKVRDENPPLLLVADELASLMNAAPLPKGLTREMKEMPEFLRMQQDLFEAGLLSTALMQIPALYRAAGIRVKYLTQQPNERYGFSTKLKGNLPHRFMLGVSPSAAEKNHAFRTPEKVPDVPKHLAQNAKVARGVGLAHPDGAEPVVFKGFFAPLEMYVKELEKRGIEKNSTPAPTQQMIRARVASMMDDMDDEPAGYGHGERQFEDWEVGPDGQPLTGGARANAAKAHATAVARESA